MSFCKINTMDFDNLESELNRQIKSNESKANQIETEKQKLMNELQNDSKESKIETDERNLDETYSFVQKLRNEINALCFCLTEKIPKIEKCADDLLEIRKMRKKSFDFEYFNEGEKMLLNQIDFNQKKAKIEEKANEIMKDVNEELIDLFKVIELLRVTKEKHYLIYRRNCLPESIPSLLVPLLGHFLMKVDRNGNFGILLRILKSLESLECERVAGENSTGNGSKRIEIRSKIWNFAVFPFLKEIIDFEWNVFSEEDTIGILNRISEIMNSINCDEISSENVILALLERIELIFNQIKIALKTGKIGKNESKNAMKTFYKTINFTDERLNRIKNESKFKKTKNLLKIYLIEFKGLSESLLSENESIEQKICDISISCSSLIKSMKNN